MVTPDELKTLLKAHRWTIAIGITGRQHVYAAKQRRGKKVATCYIATENKLRGLTEQDILAKLYRSEVCLDKIDGSDRHTTDSEQSEHMRLPL